MNYLKLPTYILLAFGIIVSLQVPAQTPSHRLAYRHPKQDWLQAYNISLKNYQNLNVGKPVEKNVQEVSVKLNNLDLSRANDWGNFNIINEAFQVIRNTRFLTLPDLPQFLRRISWLFPDDGCFARAGMAVTLLHQLKLPEPSKIFILGNLTVQTTNHPNGQVTWWYHVAPIVRARDQAMVLDAAIDPKKPLPLIDWIRTMTPDPMRVRLAICSANSYEPADGCYKSPPPNPNMVLKEQSQFLHEEWQRVRELKQNPQEVLGEHPPW